MPPHQGAGRAGQALSASPRTAPHCDPGQRYQALDPPIDSVPRQLAFISGPARSRPSCAGPKKIGQTSLGACRKKACPSNGLDAHALRCLLQAPSSLLPLRPLDGPTGGALVHQVDRVIPEVGSALQTLRRNTGHLPHLPPASTASRYRRITSFPSPLALLWGFPR